MHFGAPLTALRGVGRKRAAALAEAGLRTVGDLLFAPPLRYLDRTHAPSIAQAPLDREVTVVARVRSARDVRGGRRRFVVELEDGSGRLLCVWFGRTWASALSAGDWVAAAGKLTRFGGTRQIVHPEVEVLFASDDFPATGSSPAPPRGPWQGDTCLQTSGLVPIYRSSASLRQQGVTTRLVRRLVREALDGMRIPDFLPEGLRARQNLIGLEAAVGALHFPASMEDVERARRRLAFEELLTTLLWARQARAAAVRPGRTVRPPAGFLQRAVSALPFPLTGAQVRALDVLLCDMESGRPMHRLLQGDVGSGKTVVAALAALCAAEGGGQAALMVPTEILALQHVANLRKLSSSLGVPVVLVTGSMPPPERSTALGLIAVGRPCIVVGTHALLEDDVVFADLALAVVDEQHRFGVRQRAALRAKGAAHLLVMTATPIPRSLALTVYGDLDVTVLDEAPPGRPPVRTGWRGAEGRPRALSFVREEVSRGRQAFVVCPLVESSSRAAAGAATVAFEDLSSGPLSGLRLGLLHGRMDVLARARVMDDFRDGRIDVLVATTVVEVGVDVPNATVMFVEHAERFGLSQLHQLRGRVGRGPHPSYCVMIADPEGDLSPDARQRLDAICRTADGFEIAERDLAIRGAGELFGTRQAGVTAFRFADLLRDAALIESARDEADLLLAGDPGLSVHPGLQARVRAFGVSHRAEDGAG